MSYIKQKFKNKEYGSITVEATISLTAFMFAMFTIYSLINICFVQSKMTVAVNSAAKELSQYAYLYSTFGLDKHMSGSGGKSSELMGAFSDFLSEIGNTTEDFSTDISGMFNTTADVAANDSLAEYLKNGGATMLAKSLVEKNLKVSKDDTADSFLRRFKVVNGLDGLNFVYTSFLNDVDQDQIDLIVTYEVQVIKFLNIDYKFKFVQRGKTKAWNHAKKADEQSGTSNDTTSETQEDSIWHIGPVSRGEFIADSEKKNYTYTSDSNGYHAFDSKNNQFIRIRSIDPFEETYSDPSKAEANISNTLQSTYRDMKRKVEKLDETITVNDSNGNEKTFSSDPDSRTYKMVIVVPEDTDLETFKNYVKAFEEKQREKGEPVVVEIKPGYGNSQVSGSSETENETP